MNFIKSYFESFLSLFYPQLCVGCREVLNKNEDLICLDCLYKLPRTNFHRLECNLVEQTFWGRIPIQKATSFLYFNKKGRVRQLMHAFKYKSKQEIGFYLGNLFAREILSSKWFKSIDIIVPVPLHPDKLKVRGYNQSEIFAQGIAEVLNIPVKKNILERIKASETQTNKNRLERWDNVDSIFGISENEKIEDKHILLIDDVITTGATIEACAFEILKVKGTSLSVASLAYAAN